MWLLTWWMDPVRSSLKDKWRLLLSTVDSAFTLHNTATHFKTVIIGATNCKWWQQYDCQNIWLVFAPAGSCKADVDWHKTRATHCTVKHGKWSLHVSKSWSLMYKMPYPFELIGEWLCGFDEFSFLVLVAVFNLKQLCLQLSLWHKTKRHQLFLLWSIKNLSLLYALTMWSYLVYHQRLDLAFEDLHASSGNNWPHIWDNALAENLTNETMVALETSCSWVLYGKPIIIIWGKERHQSYQDCSYIWYTCQKEQRMKWSIRGFCKLLHRWYKTELFKYCFTETL